MQTICTTLLAIALVITQSACSSVSGSTSRDVGGSRVDYFSVGEGNPLVVFETGMGVNMSTWKPILRDVAASTRVFTYDRPGYGASSAHDAPKSASGVARRLRRILNEIGHEPPFVLVGHSLGGLYINAFARIYPDDVAGVVMIDSSHPAQFGHIKENHPVMYGILVTTGSVGPRRYEVKVISNAGDDFSKLGPFPRVPMAVLTAEKSSYFESKDFRAQWLRYQKDLAGHSELATHTLVSGSNHFIHKSQPTAVVQAIQRVIAQARQSLAR